MQVALSPRRPPVLGHPESLDPATAARRADVPVALVNMPFTSARRPSLQLATLAPISRSHGFPTTTYHLNLDFAARVGSSLYELLCTYLGWPTGEWLFAREAFGPEAPDQDRAFVDAYQERLAPTLGQVDVDVDRLVELRRSEVPAFLDAALDDVDWSAHRVVGFTSTFQQNSASFALATRLKRRYPDIIVLFGGSNFEGPMGVEWLRSVPAIDYAVNGEADLAFSQLLAVLADGGDPLEVPGVMARRDGEVVTTEPSPPFDRMDELPVPDYDEFFERSESLGLVSRAERGAQTLPFESARGCWWGAKRHCTFCGLNGGAMAYRAKSAERVEQEIATLAFRYRSHRLDAADNILEPSFVDSLFPRLSATDSTYQLFYEVKADLTRDQIRVLRDGGLRRMQPGIESLSTHVLALMRKGVRAIQNVNVLRWGLYYGIDTCWNIIYGFPGETEDDQRFQADLIPDIVHLQPPTSCGRITLDRFSPLFQDRESFPAVDVRADDRLRYVYPDRIELDDVATSFDHHFPDALPDECYAELDKQAAVWREAWADGDVRPSLCWWSSPGLLQIEDQRRPESPGIYTFEEPLASVYLACSEKPVKAAAVAEALDLPYEVDEVEQALDEFCSRGLMMRDGNLFLALALPATGGYPRPAHDSSR